MQALITLLILTLAMPTIATSPMANLPMNVPDLRSEYFLFNHTHEYPSDKRRAKGECRCVKSERRPQRQYQPATPEFATSRCCMFPFIDPVKIQNTIKCTGLWNKREFTWFDDCCLGYGTHERQCGDFEYKGKKLKTLEVSPEDWRRRTGWNQDYPLAPGAMNL
ncbi:hypothetical protein BDV28DRAFT_142542 [Aspergillus coremiiformis]|uniref:Uncharacterized protein n=1 Tax=Aspergillus coremiiformis TaxID=138285 RepID=A0A5N6YUU4_9EURO|nr:hypothetical protein BDV28DRAFT_142542 [Aspergillus coremiiformis]